MPSAGPHDRRILPPFLGPGLKSGPIPADADYMSTASRPFNQLPRPVKRLVYASLCVALFMSVSAVLHPERSMADIQAQGEMNQSRVILASEADKLAANSNIKTIQAPTIKSARPLMGTLTGSPYFIWVYAGENGPLYTVADREGRILATEVDADTLYERVPEVSVQSLQLKTGNPGPLMMVDPASQQH